MTNNLDILFNKELNRWELHFANTPEGKLSDYLVRLGYRFSSRKPRLYFAPKQDAYKIFGEDLKKALQKNESYVEIIIKPSYAPELSNITHNKFSYVTLSHQTPTKVGKKNFVIFDQYKKIAEAIGQQYGERVYGKNFIGVEATPRVEKRAAKKLLEKNMVINPLETTDRVASKTEVSQQTSLKEEKKSLTNDSGIYTQETAGDRLEIISIPIPSKVKYDAAIKIIHDENDKYRFATSTLKKFGDHSGGTSPVSNSSTIYETKEEVLVLGFQEIVTQIQRHIKERDTIISDQNKKNKLLHKALTATLDYAKELGVKLVSNDEIHKKGNTKLKKRTQPKEKNEANPTSNPKTSGKKNTEKRLEKIETPVKNDLKNLVSSVTEKLEELADQTVETTKDKLLIENENIQFKDALKIKGYEVFEKEVRRILGEQEFWVAKMNRVFTKESYIRILSPLTKVLGLPLLTIPSFPTYRIVQKWTSIQEDLLARFQEFIDTNPDTLHFTYLPSATRETDPKDLTILRVEIESDRDKISFLHRKETNELVINSLNDFGDSMSGYNGSDIPMGKLVSAISYMISYPETLQIKPYTIAPYENLNKAQVRDIERNGVKIPNVLIPKGVVNTIFESENVEKEKAKKYAKRFPKLFGLTDQTLKTATSKQLFSLAQLYPLEAYGIDIDWKAFTSYWQSNGERIFKTLGYPTEHSYPFVHLNTGYINIATLGNILNNSSGNNQWLSVVESYRPIADMDKALSILEERIKELITKRAEYIDPETGRVKKTSPEGEIYNSLSNQIQHLREQKDNIQAYQHTQISMSKDITENKSVPSKSNEQTELEKPKTEINTTSNDQNYTIKTINPFGLDIPNIRISNQIPVPFDEGGILAIHVKSIMKQYPELSKINNKTIADASALQLFQLAQLDISKLKIHKDQFHKEWAKRGESIFRELDFPMDLKHPYVSIITGYFNVESLGSIVKKNTGIPSWLWAAIEYRPIAFPHTGIVTIDLHITKFGKELKELQRTLAHTSKNRDKVQEEIESTTRVLNDLEASKEVIRSFITYQSKKKDLKKKGKTTINQTREEHNEIATISEVTAIDPIEVIIPEIPRLIATEKARRIRKEFQEKGFSVSFTGKEAFSRSISIEELDLRYKNIAIQLDEKIKEAYNKFTSTSEKDNKKTEDTADKNSKQKRKLQLERVTSLNKEAEKLELLVANEDKVFRDELFIEVVERAKAYGHTLFSEKIEDFRKYITKYLFEGRIAENYPDQSLSKAVRILIDDYVTSDTTKPQESNHLDYLDKVVAIMHDHYMDARRLTKRQVEALKEQAGVPNLGMVWEAVELSWLLWYKMLNSEPVSFDNRLRVLTHFWDQVQPTYAYSDSSKEQYKQYSTPCPIGAIIAEYTHMSDATRIFEPSAGNGLLVLGADPQKTHVNEIDKNRQYSLEAQGFKTITHFNAAEPLPKELNASFDVMVTNPPFATWDADAFDKKRIVNQYFNKYRRLDKNRLRLEHVMSGLALHTLKDSGKAAIIIMGHLYFDDRGYIAKARPFFNWLYMHYRVDDIINLNSFKLYNKQGAVAKTMLILISGRKHKPTNKSIAPTRKEAGDLDTVVDSFTALWARVKSHIKSPLEIVIQKLKIENGYDIL